MKNQLKAVLLAGVIAVLMIAAPVRAEHFWPCDGPPQAYIDDCGNGDGVACNLLWVYWSWRNSPDGIADCGAP